MTSHVVFPQIMHSKNSHLSTSFRQYGFFLFFLFFLQQYNFPRAPPALLAYPIVDLQGDISVNIFLRLQIRWTRKKLSVFSPSAVIYECIFQVTLFMIFFWIFAQRSKGVTSDTTSTDLSSYFIYLFSWYYLHETWDWSVQRVCHEIHVSAAGSLYICM